MTEAAEPRTARAIPAWLPYVAPLVLFMVATSGEGLVSPALYPAYYSAKIAILAVLLFGLRSQYAEAKPNRNGFALGIPLGLVLTVAWVAIDRVTPHFAIFGHRTALDPLSRFAGSQWLIPFLAVRFAGLVLVAPFIEELFWRGFLLRWIISPEDFKRVPLGSYDALSFGAVVVLMAVTHPEWLAAAFFSATLNIVLNRTKNLFACVATHSVTNLALGVYVLVTHSWQYW